ncbi:MAG TPA: hypothetical protein VMW50_13540 [Dehalococcoidia bacterium]|nr:hypothetical protein [Dehalococcoidia bacterium]
MSKLDEKIAQVRKESEEKLAAEITKLERDEKVLALCPEECLPSSVSHTGYDNTLRVRYTAKSIADVLAIAKAWRDKYGNFLPVGEYRDSCVSLTAYPWDKYLDKDTLKKECDDAIVSNNNTGKGFSSLDFTFYPAGVGERLVVNISVVSISFDYGSHAQGFFGHVSANYDQYGSPCDVQKWPPAVFKKAAIGISYGGGSRDTGYWSSVHKFDDFVAYPESV